ncbi:hydroxypyruvate isomerase [Terrihabitans soli]|uniref:Hydroxypyruvate isomerase n=1 Tax=Terrihabitans soli TaxID=708113 RepID=A0A6S6QWD6_9HYPH|nr:TIM barrel protein [Terrihabitans soli]BCJ92237.1 hydroxypyruvate isomerase [Terrihabitans soli]
MFRSTAPGGDRRLGGVAAPLIDRLSAHIGYMFSDEPLEQRFRSAAEMGFGFVEHPNPYEIPASKLRALLQQTGVRMAQIALPPGGRGENGLACLPGRDADFRDALERGTDYAAEIGCSLVAIMAGVVPRGAERRDLWPLYIERLSLAAEAAARHGQTILVEAVGPATRNNYFIDDPYAALRAVDSVDGRNVRLLFDAFHAANAGIDAVRFAWRHLADIAHMHIADYPGRHEPGTGAFQFGKLFGTLDGAGYEGLIGLQYIPRGDTRTGLSWLDYYDC